MAIFVALLVLSGVFLPVQSQAPKPCCTPQVFTTGLGKQQSLWLKHIKSLCLIILRDTCILDQTFGINVIQLCGLGLVHIKVYAIRYSLYAIHFALRHRRDSATSTLHHLNVVCGGEKIVQRIANTVQRTLLYERGLKKAYSEIEIFA